MTMPRIFSIFAAVVLFVGLGGCVGTAGISTWDYRSGLGYEIERAQESRIGFDPVRGLTHDACTGVSRRQIAASGEVTEADLTTCRPN